MQMYIKILMDHHFSLKSDFEFQEEKRLSHVNQAFISLFLSSIQISICDRAKSNLPDSPFRMHTKVSMHT